MHRVATSEQTERGGARTPAAQRYSPRGLTDGERWTADALATLRQRRYRAGAWMVFVRTALERSAEDRRARPRMARQARVWGAGGAVAWVAACAGARAHENLRFRPLPGLLWWLAVWQLLDWHLAMAEGGDGHPRERLSPADAVSLARFWLVPAAFGTARSSRGFPALIIIGGLTDWLDGRIARHRGRTRLGRDLDTTADLAFLNAVALTARAARRISPLGYSALTARHALGVAVALGAVLGARAAPRSVLDHGARRSGSPAWQSAPPAPNGPAPRSRSPAA